VQVISSFVRDLLPFPQAKFFDGEICHFHKKVVQVLDAVEEWERGEQILGTFCRKLQPETGMRFHFFVSTNA
jgi:hypothetical protein